MEQLKVLMQFRKDIYALLAFPFYNEITKRYGETFVKQLYAFKDNYIENKDMIKGIDVMLKFEDRLISESSSEYWAKVFTYTFLVSENLNCIKPYESVYLSKAKLVMQEQRDQVLEFYSKHGKGKIADFSEPEDHIAAELGFISSMADSSLQLLNDDKNIAIIENIDAQKDFLDKHLLKWIDKLSNDMQKPDEASFFAGLGLFTKGFIYEDRLALNELTK